MSVFILRWNPARLEVGITTLRLAKLSCLAWRMRNLDCRPMRPQDRARNFGIAYMRATATVIGLQSQQLERKKSTLTESLVLSGKTGQFAGCEHEGVTTTRLMVNQSDCSEYRSTSQSVSMPSNYCAKANNGSGWQRRQDGCMRTTGILRRTWWCDLRNMSKSSVSPSRYAFPIRSSWTKSIQTTAQRFLPLLLDSPRKTRLVRLPIGCWLLTVPLLG